VADGTEHVLADALTDDDLDALARAILPGRAGDDPPAPVLLGGAAGFAGAIARTWGRPGDANDVAGPGGGRALIVSGSCSARTLEQVGRFDGPRVDLDAYTLDADADGTVDAILERLSAEFRRGAGPVLVSSSADPVAVRVAQEQLGVRHAAGLLERAAGQVAARAVRELGVRRMVVAGGETSGAVAAALGLRVLRVGPAAAPGVPWMVPVDGPPVAVLLKSGNFGGPDLFHTAWELCP
jgi:uncharacterized protein YgbK (DUF1537 family)